MEQTDLVGVAPNAPDEGFHPAELDRVTNISGTNLGNLYGGYFADPENAKVFAQGINEPQIKKYLDSLERDPVILGLGSGPALVECMVYRALENLGYKPRLIISDMNDEAMKSQYSSCELPENVKKIVMDNKSMKDIDSKTIDLVVTRASIHYEKTKSDRMRVLREVKRVLKKDGFFFNQDQAIPSESEADLANYERSLGGRYSNHITTAEIQNMHKEMFGWKNVRSAMKTPNPMHGTDNDLRERFAYLEEKREEAVQLIRKRITNLKGKGSVQNAGLINGDGYYIITPMQLLISQKK